LRLLFNDGASFGTRVNPITRRFERNFKLNRFGGSRGPEAHGPKGEDMVRVLVQGDSITWGQGVKDEADVYPSLLLKKWRASTPCVEMSVIAKPGRDMDEHLLELVRYAPEVEPDVITYQWFVNDMEIRTKGNHAPGRRIWRIPGIHSILSQWSYFWFYVDFKLDTLLPGPNLTYSDYLVDLFEGDTPEWREFEFVFRQWALEAKRHTDKVVVALYPSLHEEKPHLLDTLHRKVMETASGMQVTAIDLNETLGHLAGDPTAYASTNDGHPNEMVHALIAGQLHDRLAAQWPPLFQAPATTIPCHSNF